MSFHTQDITGQVLHIGVSYYNNNYLAQALRVLGWQVKTLTYSGEGAGVFSHGSDFSLENYVNWDGNYPKAIFDFLEDVLRSFIQDESKRKRNFSIRDRFFASLFGRLFLCVSNKYLRRIIYYFVDMVHRYFSDKDYHKNRLGRYAKKITIAALDGAPDMRLLRELFRLLLESTRTTPLEELQPLYAVLDHYQILHFTGVQNIRFLYFFNPHLFRAMPIGWDVELLRRLGKKIVYSNTGCLDGVTQSSFRKWPGPEVVCDSCIWQDRPDVCSDEKNRVWGELRNRLTDYQITLGSNRADFNDDPKVHEVPEFYCLDTEFWRPDLPIPKKYRLETPADTVKIYHAVGNYDLRTASGSQKNIKSTHIYLPLMEQFKAEGYPVELIFTKDIPSTEVRFYQAQADIVVDMLTFGFFGANVREALMLGKPVICYLRPEWLESMRHEIPEYVDELPVISATPDTIHDMLVSLITNPAQRKEIGQKSREFAVKWHSKEAGARRFNRIYADLLRERKDYAKGN